MLAFKLPHLLPDPSAAIKGHSPRCSGTDGRVGRIHLDRLHLCVTRSAKPVYYCLKKICQGVWLEPPGSSLCVRVTHLPSTISASAPHLSRNSASWYGRVCCARPSVEHPAPSAARHSIMMAADSRTRNGRLTCGDLAARAPPSERARERKGASEQASERAGERASE